MTRSRVLPALAVALTVVAVLLAVLGVNLLPLIAVAAAGWLVVLAGRWGAALGIAATVVGTGILILLQMVLSAATHVPVLAGSVVLWTLVALGAAWMLLRSPAPYLASRLRSALPSLLPPLLGPLVWTATMLLTVVLPAASRYSWIINGDSANNVLFARETIYHDGIQLGPEANPVPLPAALIALAMASGRDSTPPAGLLEHDISSFGLVWAVLIALTCFLAGVSATVIADRSKRIATAAVGAGVSLIPLSWLVTGYPLEYGFYNTHVALPVVFAAWLATVAAARNPGVALATLLGAATLLLAVWSPLVLIPLMLAIVVVIRHRRELLARRGRRLALPLLAIAQLGVFGLAVTLPSLLAQGEFLTGVGGVIPFRRWIVVVAGLAALAAAVVAFTRKRTDVALALVAVLVAGGLGVAALLFVSRAQPSPWTYYPTKLAWLMTIVFAVLAVTVAGALLTRLRPLLFGGLALLLAVTTFASLRAIGDSTAGYPWRDPITRVLADDFAATDAVVEQIFAFSDPEHPTLLWNTGDPGEGQIDFWILQMRADSTTERHDLRVFAYGREDTAEELCAIVEAMGPPVRVLTSDAGLAAEVEPLCGQAAMFEPWAGR